MDERIKIGYDDNSRYNSSFVGRGSNQRYNNLDLNDDKEGLISIDDSDFEDEDDEDLSTDYDTILEKDLRPVLKETNNG